MTGRRSVVVSVGTDHHLFDRLMGWIESWLSAQTDDVVEVYVQHGPSRLPEGAAGDPLISRDELRDRMAAADAVVLQAGPGGIVDAWVCGRRPVVVPRLPELDEIVDGHQVAFARLLAGQGRVELVEDEVSLHRALDAVLDDPGRWTIEPYAPRSAETAATIGRLVGDLVRSGRR